MCKNYSITLLKSLKIMKSLNSYSGKNKLTKAPMINLKKPWYVRMIAHRIKKMDY